MTEDSHENQANSICDQAPSELHLSPGSRSKTYFDCSLFLASLSKRSLSLSCMNLNSESVNRSFVSEAVLKQRAGVLLTGSLLGSCGPGTLLQALEVPPDLRPIDILGDAE